MYFPYFAFGCSLEINAQRTAAYLDSASVTCDAGDLKSRLDMTCDCPPLHWVQEDDGDWVSATYTNPATDQVGWFDASIPESGQFLGFMIESVTQEASIASRNFTTRLSSSGGGAIGPIRNRERRLNFSVLLFACNEPAMEYGFRFLSDALMSRGCDDSSMLCDAEFRDSCPPVGNGPEPAVLDQGRWILQKVAAVDGPVWGELPLEGSACNIRRATFTIVSELPWKFKCPVSECQTNLAGFPSAGTDCDNWDEILCGQQEVSCSVSEELVIGETGLIIEVQAGSIDLQHIEIAIRPDPYGYEAFPLTRPPGYVRTAPCDLIYIPSLPASHRIVYNTAIEEITVQVPGGGTMDGTVFIAADEGYAPSFPTLRCGAFCVSVSVSECSVLGDPYVAVSSVHREI